MKIIQNTIDKFYKKTSLAKMSDVVLLNRTDTKFIFNIKKLNHLLQQACKYYDILEINNAEILNYKTQYYDTSDFKMYIDHQNKKLNRYKIRQREYLISNIGFMEVKFKTNKKRTIKKRIPIDTIEPELSNKCKQFIFENSSFTGNKLIKSLLNGFSRITLVHKINLERITIDFKLDFKNNNNYVELPFLCIVEVKREGYAHSDFIDLLRTNRIYKKSFSKYSIGTLLLNPDFKGNSFKKTLLTLNKIKKYA